MAAHRAFKPPGVSLETKVVQGTYRDSKAIYRHMHSRSMLVEVAGTCRHNFIATRSTFGDWQVPRV